MPSTNVKISYPFRDAKGRTGKVTVGINQGGAASVPAASALFFTDLSALSNAASRDPLANYTFLGYGANATYMNIEDKVSFLFRDTSNGLHRIQVPSPKAAIFLADDETVDITNALVTAFVAHFTGGNVNAPASDLQITGLVSGFRQRRKMQRRINSFVKDPTLTITAW